MRKIILAIMTLCAVCASAQNVTEQHGFKALLNGKTAVEVFLQTVCNDGDWRTAGYVYYPNAKSPAPILIVENWSGEAPVMSESARWRGYRPALYYVCRGGGRFPDDEGLVEKSHYGQGDAYD